MKSVVLFRHALATHSLNGYGERILNAPILAEGIPPIQRLAHFLKDLESDGQFVSPILRCQQTAKIISEITTKNFTIDPRLTEFQGEAPTETLTNLGQRCQQFVQEIEAQAHQHVWICTHGAVIWALTEILLHGDFNDMSQMVFPATGELWIFRHRKLQTLDFN